MCTIGHYKDSEKANTEEKVPANQISITHQILLRFNNKEILQFKNGQINLNKYFCEEDI